MNTGRSIAISDNMYNTDFELGLPAILYIPVKN